MLAEAERLALSDALAERLELTLADTERLALRDALAERLAFAELDAD
mgnify:FL=1